MVGTYFDSGVLVKNYCEEINSADAISLILAETPPLPLTHLQEAEIRNALRVKHYRGEIITALQLKSALALLDEDIREGRLVRPVYAMAAVFARAESLSHRYASKTGARMLDILHVAAALEIGSAKFVSFDVRQRTIAAKSGLKVSPRAM